MSQYDEAPLVHSPVSSPQPQVHFLAAQGHGSADAADPESGHTSMHEEETEEPQMSVAVSVGLLVVVTVVSSTVMSVLVRKVTVVDLHSSSRLQQNS